MRHSLMVMLIGIMALLAIPAVAQGPFLGEVDVVAFNFAPKGWALCSGQLLPINQNQALFALLGTTYGGDGITTFALPDLRGRRIVGAGQGSGLSSYNLGEKSGEETVTITLSQMPQHSHAPQASGVQGTALTPAGNVWASQNATSLFSNAPAGTAAMAPVIGTAGGGQPHDNMPPYLVMNYIIALQGIFPARD